MSTDEFRWLEDTSADTQEWIERQHELTYDRLLGPTFEALESRFASILQAKDKLPVGSKAGNWVYNFYTDADHPRGLVRRTSYEDYLDEPQWQTVLDIDALGRTEGVSWVYGGMRILPRRHDRALIFLSPGGSDANEVREFDLTTCEFIDDGFRLPLSKGTVAWADCEGDELLVARDFGDGTLTASGYPAQLRRWHRGEDEPTRILLKAEEGDQMVAGGFDALTGRTFAIRVPDFRTSVTWEVDGDSLTEIRLPLSAQYGPAGEWMTCHLREDWELDGTTYPAGAFLVMPYRDALEGPDPRRITTLFTPSPQSSLLGVTELKSSLVLSISTNLAVSFQLARPPKSEADEWAVEDMEVPIDRFDMASVSAVSRLEGDEVWVLTSGFLTPTRILHGEAGSELTEIRRAPERFDALGLEVRQLWATSKDGTEIPYYAVGRPDSLDGTRPARCLLDGYGGFEVANMPSYLSIPGAGWLEEGGVYALANIRGGGEFGPSWHQAALRAHRHRAYEDFAAVARDLTDRGITTVDRLAATGGSNGGLLIGNMYTTYPELFGALVCRVPLLDMKRFSHLLAGHSWIDEYGDPDTEDWEYLKNYSPYHNVRPAGSYPPILLTTSSADDRVHPGHARKFAALLEKHGKDMLFWENTEGGHGGAADAKQRAKMLALTYSFLDARLS